MTGVAVSEALIRREAGAAAYDRGYDYYAAGKVRGLIVDAGTARATVDGDYPYRVRVEATLTGLDGECSCPQGQHDAFCKHCVAVALGWVCRQAIEPAEQTLTSAELRAFLLQQDVGWLARELVRAADADPLLRARLEVAAGRDPREAFDDTDLRHQLRGSSDVVQPLSSVERLVDQGFPDAAVGLAEYALEQIEANAEQGDESDVELRIAIEYAERVHLRACRAGSQDPRALAERLAARALDSEHDVFLTALPDYAAVLGPSGMARYREVVEAAWRERPVGSYPVGTLMERLAETEGDVDALVAVLSRDVTSPATVWRIARALRDDGRDDEALAWVERGLTEFPPDARLRRLAADCHLRAGRRGDAVELLWLVFVDDPTRATYLDLGDAAGPDRDRWRERALRRLTSTPDVLVEVLLHEGDVAAAWAAGGAGGCGEQMWLRLARARAVDHPADALPVLRDVAARLIARTGRGAYREAARLLVEAGALARRTGREDAFGEELARLRTEHRAKRALRDELDRAGLP